VTALRRFRSFVLVGLSLAACRIQATPEEYIDRQQTPAGEAEASQAELRSRLSSMAQGLQRRSSIEVAAALAPHPDVFLFGVDSTRAVAQGSSVNAVLAEIAAANGTSPGPLAVTVDAENRVAWFHQELHDRTAPGPAGTFRFSGVFVRHDGEWRLIEGHLSRPLSAFAPTPPAAPVEGDTVAAGG
jgi:hypothetical protein